jgi:hypothetical protein
VAGVAAIWSLVRAHKGVAQVNTARCLPAAAFREATRMFRIGRRKDLRGFATLDAARTNS